jgi:excisionase family DNA binding protein
MNSPIRSFGISDREMAAASDRTRGRRYLCDEITFLTISQVAERLNVTTRTVRRWIKKGDLPVHRFGGVVRIAERDLLAFIALRRQG